MRGSTTTRCKSTRFCFLNRAQANHNHDHHTKCFRNANECLPGGVTAHATVKEMGSKVELLLEPDQISRAPPSKAMSHQWKYLSVSSGDKGPCESRLHQPQVVAGLWCGALGAALAGSWCDLPSKIAHMLFHVLPLNASTHTAHRAKYGRTWSSSDRTTMTCVHHQQRRRRKARTPRKGNTQPMRPTAASAVAPSPSFPPPRPPA